MVLSYNADGHGEVTVSGFVSSGTWAIRIRPAQPPSGLQCRRRLPETFEFEIQL